MSVLNFHACFSSNRIAFKNDRLHNKEFKPILDAVEVARFKVAKGGFLSSGGGVEEDKGAKLNKDEIT